MATGAIVDATIIDAPCATKNAEKASDPEMHQTKKGNQWYFGIKAHFGVDSGAKLIHAAIATPPMAPRRAQTGLRRESSPGVRSGRKSCLSQFEAPYCMATLSLSCLCLHFLG